MSSELELIKDEYVLIKYTSFNITETMENWTEEKLREVVAAKMGTEDPEADLDKGKQTQDRYDIVCKHFIDAIESSK